MWPHLAPSQLKTIADPPERDRWARLRFSIIGPLMAAPPAPRQLGAAFLALAAKTWHAGREELLEGLNHLLAGAGNASLMTPALRHTLCDHAAGNYRILTTMAAELLAAATQRELPQLDEKLYLEVFAQPEAPAPRRAAARR